MQDGRANDESLTAKVVKIGGELAILLPIGDVMRLGLKEGDDVEVKGPVPKSAARPAMTREEGLAVLQKYRGIVPPGFKFDRDEANERRPHDEA